MTELIKPRVLPFAEPFPNSLVSRIKRGELTMEQFIMDRTTYNAIRRCMKLLTDFVVGKVEEFVDILLNSYDKNLQKNAMKLLRSGNKRIIEAVANSQAILKFGDNLSEDSDLNRFPAVIEICLSECPHNISETFAFLPRMWIFAKHSSVNYMFEKLLQPLDNLSPIHYYLKMYGFPNYIAKKALKSKDTELKYSLFKILIFCLQNPILENCSVSGATIDLIQESISSPDHNLRSIAWKFADESLILQDNDEVYGDMLLDDCIDTITDLNTENTVQNYMKGKIYYEYQVAALVFLTKLINIRPLICSKIDGEYLILSLTRILEQFPNHSIALSTVFDFIKTALDSSYLRSYVMNIFVSKVNEIVEDVDGDHPRTQVAFCVVFMHDLEEQAKNDDIINEEITPIIRGSFKIADDFQNMIHPTKASKTLDYFNDLIDGIDLACMRPGRIVSSQDF